MKIAVHAKMLSEQRLNGMGYYTHNLLKALSAIDGENTYDLYSSDPLVHKVRGENFREKVISFPRFWTYTRLPIELLRNRHDIVFVPHEKLPPFVGGKKVITVYDLHTLREYFSHPISLSAKLHFLVAITRTIKKADLVLAISEATKKSVIEVTGISPDKVVVTPLGYDSTVFYRRPDEAVKKTKKRYGITGEYFINTSSLLWYRKNLPRLVWAFGGFKAKGEVKLVITGKKGEDYEEITDTVKKLGLGNDVLLPGYVPAEDLPLLLSGALAMFFPSLHEGFGLPILEAMACGCPVVTSHLSSMPEVAGDAAILVDPLDEGELTGAMERLYARKDLRDGLKKKGLERVRLFSWEKTAAATLKAFESLVRPYVRVESK